MKLSAFAFISLLVGLLTASAQDSLEDIHFDTFTPSTTLRSTGLTDAVQWDGYSLFVQGKRVIVWSGEVHPFRLPVPGLWPDIMQKIKALGFNAVSFYTFWGLHNPSPGVLDFSGWKDLQPFIDAAQDSGLWLIARPGPYINAEITGGGIPGWVTAMNSSLRSSDPLFREACSPYWKAIGSVVSQNQINNGGPVIGVEIENEYYLDADGDIDTLYAQELEQSMRDSGVDVPFTFNDASEEGRLRTGQGAVNIYGFDSYPQSADCSDPYNWPYQVDETYRPFFQNTSGRSGEPFYIPEFQGGTTPIVGMVGYDQCTPLYSAAFERVFYLHNLAQGVKMINFYMTFGGTNFGHTAFPRAITSYDYYAAISEDRSLNEPKYGELKLISHFVRSATSLPQTWLVGSSNSSYTSKEVQVDELRNPTNDAGFYIVRQANSSYISYTEFELTIAVWGGNVTAPMALNGRDSRVVVSNYCFESSCISHSTAAIFTAMSIDDTDVLVVYGDAGQLLQVGFPSSDCVVEQITGETSVQSTKKNGRTIVSFTLDGSDHSVVRITGGKKTVMLHIMDTITAYASWPIESASVLISGPYLVRSASVSDATLELTGDVNMTTTISIVAPSNLTSFTWNNKTLKATQTDGIWSATITGPSPVSTPSIGSWKMADSLPEISTDFDDSNWTIADKTETNNPNVGYDGYSGKYILYMQDYGYYVGNTLLRGHFNGTGTETGFNVSLSPGTNGAGAVWLNGEYLGSAFVSAAGGVEDTNVTFSFPDRIVKGSENVIVGPSLTELIQTIVLDNTGLEETDQFSGTPNDIKSPRGIRGYSLIGGKDLVWRVQGNLGGNENFPDKVRGLYNVGGLYGERMGWYLPGYGDSDWKAAAPLTRPGVAFYRSEVAVVVESGMDVHHSFIFPNVTGAFRAQLYVNGWQFGRRFGDVGPQLKFPVPPGILVNGTNTLALSVFALNGTEADLTIGAGGLSIQVDSYTASSLDLKGLKAVNPTYGEMFKNIGFDLELYNFSGAYRARDLASRWKRLASMAGLSSLHDSAYATLHLPLQSNPATLIATAKIPRILTTHVALSLRERTMEKWTPELWQSQTAAELYAGGETFTTPPGNPLLDQAVPTGFSSDDMVLENGCGVGFFTELLVSRMAGRGGLICGDIDQSSIELVRRKNELEGWKAKVDLIDALSIPYPDETFSHVFANFVYPNMLKPIDALKESHRVLKPGGTLAFTTWGHNGLMLLLQHAALFLPTAPNMRTKELATLMLSNESTLAELGFIDIQIKNFDFNHTAENAKVMAWETRILIQFWMLFANWRDEDSWGMFEKIEEVLRKDFGDGPVKVRSVAMLVTAKKGA